MLRILYLEDNPQDAELAQATLAEAGLVCDVLRVETREAFEQALAEGEFDLILSDKSLPQFDGLSALALTREKRSEIPFIFVSGTMGEEAAIESLKRGATDYVLKQRIARLAPVTKRALEESAARAAARSAEAARKRMSTAVEYAAEAVVITDRAGNIEYVNPAFEQITGYRLSEVIGQNPRILRSGAQDEAFYRDMWETLTRGQTWRASLVNRKRDGTTYPLEETISPVTDADGKTVNYVAVQHDISQRVRFEEALVEREKRFRALIENSSDGIVLATAEGTITYTTPSTLRMLGYTEKEFVGQNLFGFIHPDDQAMTAGLFAGLLQAPGAMVSAPCRVRHRDGRWRWIDSTGTNLLEEPGVGAIVANLRDITERKQAEEQLVLSDQVLQRVSSLVVVADAEGKIVYVSPSIQQILGFEPAEALGEGWWELTRVNAEGGQHERQSVMRVARGESSPSAEPYERQLKDRFGHVHWISWQDARGPGQTIIGVGHDITERKQSEEALRESEEKYRYLFERNPNTMWVYELDTLAFLAVNDSAIQRYGYTRDAFLRMTLKDMRPPEDVPGLIDTIAEMPPGVTNTRDRRHRLKDGQLIDVEITSQAIDFEGRSARLASVSDVTERKRAEERVRQQIVEATAVNRISRSLRTASTLPQLLDYVLDETLAMMHTERGSIWLHDPSADELRLAAGRNWRATVPALKRGEGIPGYVLQSGEPYRSADFKNDPRTPEDTRAIIPAGIAGACVPISSAEATVGVMFVQVDAPRELSAAEMQLLTTVAEIAGIAIHRMRLNAETEQQLQRLAALRSIDAAIGSSLDLRMTLNVLLEQVVEQLHVHAATVLLLNASTLMLEFAAGHGFRSRAVERTQLRLGEMLAGRIALDRSLMVVPNLGAAELPRTLQELRRTENFISYAGVPLIAKGQVKGILEIWQRQRLDPDPEWMNFFQALAAQAAIAIDNSQLFDGLQRSNLELSLAYDTTIEGWSRTLDLRDKETEGHTQRVTEMTERLGRAMGISGSDMIHLRRGALLHDIGKMGVPDQILLKPGPLSDEEWVIMRKHPVYAYELLSPIAFLRPALDIPYCHHEKWDGSGYPRGLKGEQIPLMARLFAVVDVWDALRSDRPYRRAWSEDKVRVYIASLSGTHFDPRAVDAFWHVVSKQP